MSINLGIYVAIKPNGEYIESSKDYNEVNLVLANVGTVARFFPSETYKHKKFSWFISDGTSWIPVTSVRREEATSTLTPEQRTTLMMLGMSL